MTSPAAQFEASNNISATASFTPTGSPGHTPGVGLPTDSSNFSTHAHGGRGSSRSTSETPTPLPTPGEHHVAFDSQPPTVIPDTVPDVTDSAPVVNSPPGSKEADPGVVALPRVAPFSSVLTSTGRTPPILNPISGAPNTNANSNANADPSSIPNPLAAALSSPRRPPPLPIPPCLPLLPPRLPRGHRGRVAGRRIAVDEDRRDIRDARDGVTYKRAKGMP